MAEAQSPVRDSLQQYSQDVLDSPAVGIVVTGPAIDNALTGAIVRSVDHGHHVLLTTEDEEAADELADSIGHLPVTIVDPDEQVGVRDPIDSLTSYAREVGFPGLIHHENLVEPVDFVQSVAAVRDASTYCVSAVASTIGDESSQVIAGILAYNEEVGIGSVVHSARGHADRVIVVDDGSRDDTAKIARQAGAQVIQHETNQGKGAAIQTLLKEIESRHCDALVLLDGDGQHTPANIPHVAKPVLEGEADLVIGSRYMDGSNYGETPRHRRFGQKILDGLTFGTSKAPVSDSQSGFRALSPKAIEKLSLRTNGYGAESEMIDSAVQNDLTIDERAVNVRYEGIDGHNENPLRHGLEVVAFIMYLVRDRHPLLFFGVPGIVITLAGALYGLDGILIYQNSGQFYPAKILVSGFLTIIGVLGMFVGLILNQVSNMISRIDSGR